MSDKIERIFVEVCFDGQALEIEDVVSDVNNRLSCYEYGLRISAHKPPPVITDEIIKQRFAELLTAGSRFAQKFSERFGDQLYLDPRLLMLAVRSAYSDIARYKLYHLEKPYSDLSDSVKRSAYITKWFSKVKPFQLIEGLEAEKEDIFGVADKPAKASMANVMFALNCALQYYKHEVGFKVKLDVDVYHEAIYDLTFREMNADANLMFFQLLAKEASGRSLIKKA